MTKFDVIRTREQQCFCFKSNYLSARLGVGVSIIPRGRIGSFESEFDLLSYEGYRDHGIRRSVQGVGANTGLVFQSQTSIVERFGKMWLQHLSLSQRTRIRDR